MSVVKPSYRATNQAITITLASLANGSTRASTAIDNTANLDDEVFIVVKIKSGSGVSSTGYADIYAYGSADNGSTYPEGITGTDAALTLVNPTNLYLIKRLNIVANTTSYESEPIPLSPVFGGTIPDHWGIAITNTSGGSFDSTEGNHAKFFAGIQYQIV